MSVSQFLSPTDRHRRKGERDRERKRERLTVPLTFSGTLLCCRYSFRRALFHAQRAQSSIRADSAQRLRLWSTKAEDMQQNMDIAAIPWCAIHSPISTVFGFALRAVKFPRTMCFEYVGWSHIDRGEEGLALVQGSSEASPMDWISEGELGRGGTALGADWLEAICLWWWWAGRRWIRLGSCWRRDGVACRDCLRSSCPGFIKRSSEASVAKEQQSVRICRAMMEKVMKSCVRSIAFQRIGKIWRRQASRVYIW